jgi:hypothetical protein
MLPKRETEHKHPDKLCSLDEHLQTHLFGTKIELNRGVRRHITKEEMG